MGINTGFIRPWSPLNFLCGTVKVAEANTREGPGKKYKRTKTFPILRYTSFRILQQKKAKRGSGSWAKVEDEDESVYWVFRKLIWVQ